MITKFKLFGSINEGEPKVGDYVICEESVSGEVVKEFISNNIGIFSKSIHDETFKYSIEYENIPDNIYGAFTNKCRRMSRQEIKYWSKDKEELEILLVTNKYNL